jgi:hypothetical protein
MALVEQADDIASEFDDGTTTERLKDAFDEFQRLLRKGLQSDGQKMPCIASFGNAPYLPVQGG